MEMHIEHDGCKGCIHDDKTCSDIPCRFCKGNVAFNSAYYDKVPDLYEAVKPKNLYWDRVTDIAENQRSKGLKEYGHPLDQDTSGIIERINLLEEELVDSLMYIEHIKEYLRNDTDNKQKN